MGVWEIEATVQLQFSDTLPPGRLLPKQSSQTESPLQPSWVWGHGPGPGRPVRITLIPVVGDKVSLCTP